jgi:DNA mismatch repair protein MutL
MPEIRILSDQVANQIAAGEVVERPVAVLKELVENSIDAEAKKIEIEFRNGGKSYLRVEDDGVGMTSDQALLALERHATSKIRKAIDLNKVGTFGFRGEALPSIASVSRFILRSRFKSSQEGTEIFVNGGKMIHCKECGMPHGTRVEVSHLFNSVPGRRKFLKTEITEATHLVHMAKLYALAHPAITFTLIEGGRTIFRSPACKGSEERVREIFGRGFADSLAPVNAKGNDLKINGLIGRPGQSRSTRKEMIFFVNRRPVDSKTLSYAVIEAFHTFIPKGRFPPVILFLDIDPAAVDVNVHPSKREIRFRNEPQVRTFVLENVLNHNKFMASSMHNFSPVETKVEYEKEKHGFVPRIDPQVLEIFGSKKDVELESLVEKKVLSDKKEDKDLDSQEPSKLIFDQMPHQSMIDHKLVGEKNDPGADWKLLGRFHGDLVLFSTPDGVVALHASSAYERVRFEQLEDSLRNSEQSISQTMLLPEPLEFDGIDGSNLEASLLKLRQLGFVLEEFGRNFYRLEGCPHWLAPGEAASYLRDFLEIARENGGKLQIESFARLALERQVSYQQENRDEFSERQIIDLVDQLLRCRNPYVCPRGKPVYFEIPIRDFESRFKRKL